MTYSESGAVFLSCVMFDGSVVRRRVRASGMLPSVIVIVEVAAPLGHVTGCKFWR